MIKISPDDAETLRENFSQLRKALEDIPQYLSRKTAKIISVTINIERILGVSGGEDEKKTGDK